MQSYDIYRLKQKNGEQYSLKKMSSVLLLTRMTSKRIGLAGKRAYRRCV